MTGEFGWPLDVIVIRGRDRERQESNIFGMVRRYANGSEKPHQGAPGTGPMPLFFALEHLPHWSLDINCGQ